MTRRLAPFFSYYGGKHILAPKYPPPRYKTIVEPFAGSAAYSTLYYKSDVVLLDKYSVVADIWKYLIKATRADILRLPIIEEGKTVHDYDISPVEKHLVGYWLQPASSSPCLRASSWHKLNHESVFCWSKRCRERLANQVELINHWFVECCSYDEFEHDRPATWFVDPPYLVKGYKYKCSSKDIDYRALGQWCKSRPGQVIVCENVGADWLPFRVLCSAQSAHHKKQPRKEAIWSKGNQQTSLFESAS